jgi:hypothetical protein
VLNVFFLFFSLDSFGVEIIVAIPMHNVQQIVLLEVRKIFVIHCEWWRKKKRFCKKIAPTTTDPENKCAPKSGTAMTMATSTPMSTPTSTGIVVVISKTLTMNKFDFE